MLDQCVASSFARKFFDTLWDETTWLPPNITWNDLASSEGQEHGNIKSFAVVVPVTIIFLILRYFFEKHAFSLLGKFFNVDKKKVQKVIPNHLLEKIYQRKEEIKYKQIASLAKQLDWPERKVERWLRQRYSQDRPSCMTKFCECSWRWMYYTYSVIYGAFCLWDKSWLWNVEDSWNDYPQKNISTDCWWYYTSSMAFYASLLVSHHFDVRRKDFWQMYLHHMITLTLLIVSWICKYYRIGTLILLLHDTGDLFLEGAKVAKYANCQRCCNVLFVTFSIVWIVTRLVLYPFWILPSTTAFVAVNALPAAWVFNTMLYCLQVLHIFWTHFIIKIAFRFIEVGKAEGDVRSSCSSEESEYIDETEN